MKLWMRRRGAAPHQHARGAAKARAGNPGPEGSIAKLAFANLNKAVYELCIDLLGADGHRRLRLHVQAADGSRPRRRRPGPPARCSCASRANSIEGGTSEIMRNILGERILGLPGEPRVDRDLPWSQVPRS